MANQNENKKTAEQLRQESEDHPLLGFAQTLPTDAINSVLRGETDIMDILSAELASRGLNLTGHWVGFPEANKQHEARMEYYRKGWDLPRDAKLAQY